jgi:hypothetical protein
MGAIENALGDRASVPRDFHWLGLQKIETKPAELCLGLNHFWTGS